MTNNTKLVSLALCAGIALPACQTELLFTDNYQKLQVAYDNLEAGETQTVVTEMEGLIAQTNREEDLYARQRFFAFYLITRAHMEAALGQPFLQEYTSDKSNAFRLDEARVSDRAPSSISHQVATTYNASLGRERYSGARDSATTAETGEELVPEALGTISLEDAQAYLTLAMFTVFSRLDFEERVGEVVTSVPELANLDSCDGLLSSAGVTLEMRPWIYRGVFTHLKDVDEPAAYRFAIRTMHTDRVAGGLLGKATLEGLEEWIYNGSTFDFVCGKGQCKQPVIPSEPRCLACQQTLTIDFLAVPK